jgi:hypothetical protein
MHHATAIETGAQRHGCSSGSGKDLVLAASTMRPDSFGTFHGLLGQAQHVLLAPRGLALLGGRRVEILPHLVEQGK